MNEEPSKGTTFRAIAISVVTATVAAGAVMLFAPEVPPLAIVSAWIGTAFTLAIWFMIYR